MAHAWPLPPAIASRCAANDGSCRRRRRSPTRRCSASPAPTSRLALRRCRLLAPFDRPVATGARPRIRATTRRRWMRHLHAHRSELRAFGELRAPLRAAIDILPFQLEPALALVRGHASRFLLADEVGLGKTIQAGLMLAELQPARLVRARAHRHAGRASAAVGRRAAASIRHSRGRHGRRVARGADATRCRST